MARRNSVFLGCNTMRLTASILTFALACAAGFGAAQLYTQTAEWRLYEPGFGAQEAAAMVGRRVRHSYLDDRFAVVKCQAGTDMDAVPEGACTAVGRGERGSIVRVEQFTPEQFFFVVRWDEPARGTPSVSYIETTMHRLTIEVE